MGGKEQYTFVNAFSSKKEAQELASKIRKRGKLARVTKATKAGYGLYYRVWERDSRR